MFQFIQAAFCGAIIIVFVVCKHLHSPIINV